MEKLYPLGVKLDIMKNFLIGSTDKNDLLSFHLTILVSLNVGTETLVFVPRSATDLVQCLEIIRDANGDFSPITKKTMCPEVAMAFI